MASIGHVAVGMAAGRAFAGKLGRPATPASTVGAMIALSILSMLPDLDVIAFRLGIPYAAPFGHRGASHSLCAALLVGAMAGIAALGIAGDDAARRESRGDVHRCVQDGEDDD